MLFVIILKYFSFITIKFQMQPFGEEKKKIDIFGPGRMTKTAAMPINTVKKFF